MCTFGKWRERIVSQQVKSVFLVPIHGLSYRILFFFFKKETHIEKVYESNQFNNYYLYITLIMLVLCKDLCNSRIELNYETFLFKTCLKSKVETISQLISFITLVIT